MDPGEGQRSRAFEHLVMGVCGLLLADRFGAQVEGVIASLEDGATDVIAVPRGYFADAKSLTLARDKFQGAVSDAADRLRASIGGLLLQGERQGAEGTESPMVAVAAALGLDARLTALERLLGVSEIGGEGSEGGPPDLLARLMTLERFLPILVAAAAESDPRVAQRLNELASG